MHLPTMIGVLPCWRRILATLSLFVFTNVEPLYAAPIIVNSTSTNSSGSCVSSCTLTDAIITSNITPGTDTIHFQINGGGLETILPIGPFPPITDPVIIDGTTQNPSSSVPAIEINGSGMTGNDPGLLISVSGCVIKGLNINGFKGSGIKLSNAANTTISGNWIGLAPTGVSASSNSLYGIEVVDSSGSTIGGTISSERNIISGNGLSGISLTNSDNVTITGNWIGLSASGSAAIGNTEHGVEITSSDGTIIGNSTPGLRNIISGNGASGVRITSSNNTSLDGNWIGLDATGASALGNTLQGIDLDTVSGTIIGGASPNSQNVISANGASGIKLSTASNTTIAGNWIGLDSTGALNRGNTLQGIEVSSSSSTTIGGATSSLLNIIAGNAASGIKLSNASATTIAGNWIGLDATGLVTVGNALHGVDINSSPNTVIGGAASSARNVIAGNGLYGISISDSSSSGTQIKGNYIGINHLGESALTTNGGVLVLSSNNTIGGTNSGEGNVIAGVGATPPYYQILLSQTEGNQVHGNYIGTNAAASASLSLSKDGVPLGIGIGIHDSRDNTIGTPGSGNVISGNNTGIELKAASAANFPTSGNTIQSNNIGTNAAGTGAVPNINGITISASTQNVLSDTTIGGVNATGSFKGNIISGNGLGEGTGRGIQLIGSLIQDTVIQGNYIGTAADGVSDLGNTGPGILLDCSNTEIGGENGANVIAHNGETGITVLSGTGNRISRNSLFSNQGLGIDQGELPGPNPADQGDGDTGPNNYQNFPAFAVTAPSQGNIQVKGTLDSTPSETFELEFYLNTINDESGYGEGESLLGTTTVITNAQGKAPFTVNLTGTIPAAGGVSAIATDSKGNSSEFSLSMRPTKEIKPGGRVEQPPAVAVVDNDVTVSLPRFKPPRKKKQKRSAITIAARAPKPTVNYEITVRGDRRNLVKRINTKRNVVTIRNLRPGNYATTYRVQLKEREAVTATTRRSPAQSFTIRPRESGVSPRSIFNARWCHPIFLPACDALWP